MKKVIMLILFVVSVSSVLAQVTIIPGLPVRLSSENVNLEQNITGLKLLEYSLSGTKSGNFVERKSENGLLGSIDTLNDVFKRSTGVSPWAINISGNGYILIGTNPFYIAAGERFSFSGKADLEGFLMSTAYKSITMPADTFPLYLVTYNSATQALDSLFSVGKFTLENIDTASLTPSFNYLPLTTIKTVNFDFIAFAQTRRADDLYMIHTNRQGDGNHEGRAMVMLLVNNQVQIAPIKYLAINGGAIRINGDTINFDVMILPVIRTGGTGGVAGEITINGFTLKEMSPNPVAANAKISFSLEQQTDLKIDIVNNGGVVLKTIKYENLNSGAHEIMLNMDGLAAGQHFLLFTSPKFNFATKLMILR